MSRVFLILILFAVNINADEQLQKVSLQLKWKYQFQFAGFIAAKERGFYKDAGLDVELKEFGHNTNIIQDVIDGKVDFGISDSSLIYNKLQGKKVVALMAIFQESPFILMGMKSNEIKNIDDINNKKISLYEGIDGVAIKAMLKSNKIKYISKPPIFQIDNLVDGKVDLMTAYISNEPYAAKTKGIEVVTFLPKDYGFEGYGDMLFTSEKLIKNDPMTIWATKV